MKRQSRTSALLVAGLALLPFSGCTCSSSDDAVPPTALSYSQNPALYALDVTIAENVPTVSGAVTSWISQPPMPAGLSLHPHTGVISGSPTAQLADASFTIVASNAGGSVVEHLVLTVMEIDPPSGFSYPTPNSYRVGVAGAALAPTVTGMVTGYALAEGSGALPPGFALDATTGVIDGIPLVPTSEVIDVTVEVSNPAGSTTADVSFDITGLDARFVYVANEGDDTLSIFALDSDTGQLRARGVALTGDGPAAVATSPTGDGVYVANFLDGTISVFGADVVTGALTPLPTVTAEVGARDLAVHPGGEWFYALNGLSGEISRYAVESGTGELNRLSPDTGLGGMAQAMAIDPMGDYLFVTVGDALSISVFEIDGETGDLEFVHSVPTPMVPADLVVDPSGRFVYVPSGTHYISGFELDTTKGMLTSIPGSPFTVGTGTPTPMSAAVSANGRFLYTANSLDDEVGQFAIDSESGALTELAPESLAAGTSPRAIAVAAQDGFVLVTNLGSLDMHAFAPDAGGALASTPLAPIVQTGVDPVAIAVAPAYTPLSSRSDFVYVTDEISDGVSGYDADAGPSGSGELTLMTGSPFVSGESPVAAAMHPSNLFLYTANIASGGLSVFAVDPGNGELTSGTGIASGSFSDLLLDPSGRYAFGVLLDASNLVRSYSIDGTTGELTAVGSELALGAAPLHGDVHPTGRFLYVANRNSNSITSVQIAQTTGELAFVATTATGTGPQAVAVHPTGRWLYAPNLSSDDVSQFSVDALTGEPSPLSPAAVSSPTTGGNARDIAMHPTGEFLYVANGLNDEVLLFTIDTVTGLLTGVAGTPTGDETRGVAVDASGRFLYVSVTGNDTARTFAIDPNDGTLSGSTIVSTGVRPRGLALSRDDY